MSYAERVTLSDTGLSPLIGSFGEVLIGYKSDDISVQFQYDYLNTDYDVKTPVNTGDGSVSVSSSLLTVSSTTGTASIESRKSIRYKPGHSGFIDFTASFVGAGTGYIGAFDSNDGFLLRCVNGVLSFGYRRAGSDVFSTVDTTGMDLTKINIFRILYGYLGVASPVLMVKQGDWRVLSTIETEGVLATTHVLNPVFPMKVTTSGAMTVKSGSWNGGTIGDGVKSGIRAFQFPNTPIVNATTLEQGAVTLSSTNVKTLVIFKVRDTYQSKTNKVIAGLLAWNCYIIPPTTGSGEVIFQIIANPTLSGAATYTNIDTNNSILSYDHTAITGASVSYSSGGKVLLSAIGTYSAAQGNNPAQVTFSQNDAEQIGAIGGAGDVFAIVAKDRGGNNITVRTKLIWEERF